MSSKELEQSILRHLEDSNRPYSVNDILEKFGNTSGNGKTAIQKALDNLTTREKVVEKQFGKQRIYFIKQEEDNGEGSTEFKLLENKLKSLESSLTDKLEKIKELESTLKKLTSLPSLENLESQEKQLQEDIAALETELKQCLSNNSNKISDAEKKKIGENHSKVMTAYKKRKRICNEMIESIMEGYPKTKKQFIEEVGIETDEMVNFKIGT